ncbi:MAG: Hsp20/alpha crystallin family protein [Candidatus Kerfeldbacteria bacterium]|nr:Hsp20/alpha crystallin family protein [Candidatus Kerfeldbacteria bacterium]
MANTNIFTNKLKELTIEEIEYTEDFFQRAFSNPTETDVAIIKRSATQGHRDISTEYSDEDIDENWLQNNNTFDGQLAVDVFQTETEIIITSTVAGVRSADLDIDMNGDMITIRGIRRQRFPELTDDQYFIRECYWGGFSRSIILPMDIQHDRVEAMLENGLLTIRLPKSLRSRNGKIAVQEIA